MVIAYVYIWQKEYSTYMDGGLVDSTAEFIFDEWFALKFDNIPGYPIRIMKKIVAKILGKRWFDGEKLWWDKALFWIITWPFIYIVSD